MDLKEFIAEFPDFPKPGILFYDINPLLQNPQAFSHAIDQFNTIAQDYKPDIILGIESRGFLFAPSLATKMRLPFVMIRKPGKLPGKVVGFDYEKEYGTDRLELQQNLLKPSQRVLLVDDLLATGGTMKASIKLVEKTGATPVASLYMIELLGLGAAAKMPIPQHAILQY